jgi:hypothetical protein
VKHIQERRNNTKYLFYSIYYKLKAKSLKKEKPSRREGQTAPHVTIGTLSYQEVVSLLATCHKRKQGGDEERREKDGKGVLSQFFPLFLYPFFLNEIF